MKIAEFELNRRKRMEENRKEAEKLKLKEKAIEFFGAEKSKKKPTKIFVEDRSDLELPFPDRAYDSGHDSVSEEERVYVVPRVCQNVILLKNELNCIFYFFGTKYNCLF